MIQSDKVGAVLLELATSETMQLSWPEGTVTNELPNGTMPPTATALAITARKARTAFALPDSNFSDYCWQ
jgi:hypothetical protein